MTYYSPSVRHYCAILQIPTKEDVRASSIDCAKGSRVGKNFLHDCATFTFLPRAEDKIPIAKILTRSFTRSYDKSYHQPE